MHRHQLALQMGGQLSQLQTVGGQGTEYFITISLALGGAFQIEQATVPRRNLHTLVAQTSGPVRDMLQAVERSSISGELRQEYCRTLDGFHRPRLTLSRYSPANLHRMQTPRHSRLPFASFAAYLCVLCG